MNFRELENGMGSVVPVKAAPVVRRHKGWHILEMEDGLFAVRSPDGLTFRGRHLSAEAAVDWLELRWKHATSLRIDFTNAAKNNRHFRHRRSS